MWIRRIRYWLRSGQREASLSAEMGAHIAERTEELREEGLSEPEARAKARREFGNLGAKQEESREVWIARCWWNLWQDLRYAARLLRKSPGFTAVAVLSLALGIGANTAIFSIIHAVMLRTLPVENPQQLVHVTLSSGTTHLSNPLWEEIRDSQDALAGVVAFADERFDLSDGGESRYANGLWVSGDFFRVLGVPALRGRVLNPSDDQHGCGAGGPVAVISYDFWRSEFQARPEVIGETLRLNRKPFTIVGVTPPWMKGLIRERPFDVAIPIGCDPILRTDQSSLEYRSWWWLRLVGRLKPGVTLVQTEDRLNALAPGILAATVPTGWDSDYKAGYLGRRFELRQAATGFSRVGEQYRNALSALMAITGLVLLIACANIANLLLARAAARQRELSMRTAIGASRWRVVRQLITESVALAGAGAGVGSLLAIWAGKLLVRVISTTGDPLEIDLSPDLYVLGFTAAVGVITVLIFGLVPALRATSSGLSHALKDQGRGAIHGASRFRLARGFAAVQIAISFVLLLAAGLFMGTLRNLLAVDTGFQAEDVLLVNVNVQQVAVERPQRLGLYQEILERLRSLPAVTSAAASWVTPISGSVWNFLAEPEGNDAKSESDTSLYMNQVSPGYFHTMGTPLVVGRDFDDRDNLSAPLAMVINETAARQFFDSENPIGKTIRLPSAGGEVSPSYHVIGVAKDAKYRRVDEETPRTGFVAMTQDGNPSPNVHYEVRYSGSLAALTPFVREAIAEVNPGISLEFRSFETQVEESLQQPRVVALLSAVFGALALVLATVGLYGLTSYTVARRKGEIGVRMALGARPGPVLWLVLRDVAVLLIVGTALGALAALAAGRLVTSLLYGTEPNDPVWMVLAAAVLTAAAAVAAFLPARRAARLDPATVLREE